ncbi:RsbRD N-terminal domain-containing protein [Maridesulfovibrio bastinii]|uniref:RsbRD N-terminal domain-containing protein n=1 Tax=Maridesulfovibrio bastinii TaxID=47157 RepID=UPI00040C0F7F|nr:RsbRD N-terminal domain-containing protein [Maridesulfovibrio bastinii]
MSLLEEISERREEIAKKWCDLVFSTYPVETQKVWKSNKDRFTNPVGAAIRKVTAQLLDLVIDWDNGDAIAECLDELVKIRTVQDFAPSKSLSFALELKKLIREQFFEKLKKENSLDELLAFETRIDNLGLIAFDVYTKNRDLISQMRIDEVKRAYHMILRRANKIEDASAKGAGQV